MIANQQYVFRVSMFSTGDAQTMGVIIINTIMTNNKPDNFPNYVTDCNRRGRQRKTAVQ